MSGGQWMIVLIVLIGVVGGIIKSRHRSGASPDQGTLETSDAARLRDEVRTLKERIAVLERIATDKDSHLDREIERLRDR